MKFLNNLKDKIKPFLSNCVVFLNNLNDRLTGSWKTTLTGVFSLIMYILSSKYDFGQSEVEVLNEKVSIVWSSSLEVLSAITGFITLILTKESKTKE